MGVYRTSGGLPWHGLALRTVETPSGDAPGEVRGVQYRDEDEDASGDDLMHRGRDADGAQARAKNTEREHARRYSHRAAAAAHHRDSADNGGRRRGRQHIGERDW